MIHCKMEERKQEVLAVLHGQVPVWSKIKRVEQLREK
jgi:hypothetical protein